MIDYFSIAKVVYQANKTFCETNFDFSHMDWNDAPDGVKCSYVRGVVEVINNPNITPEELHEAWKKEKTGQGWVLGENKNPDKKTHPCLTNYRDIPEFEKRKDNLFIAIVKELIKEQ